VNGAFVTGEIRNEAIYEGGLPAELLEHLQYVEHVSGMLPVQCAAIVGNAKKRKR